MKQRLAIAGALAGFAVLAVVVVVVLQFGRLDPSPPSLVDRPNPSIPGNLVYFNRDGCLVRAAASGASRDVSCREDLRPPGLLAWVDSGTIATWQDGRLFEIDLASGERTHRTDIRSEQQKYGTSWPPFSMRGESATADGGRLVVVGADGARETIASFDVGSRWIQPVSWSPDGNWIVVQWQPPRDQALEIWIVSRDGETKGTIATDAGFYGGPVGWWIDGVGGEPSLDEIVDLSAR